jgi:predicted transcriptional regulator
MTNISVTIKDGNAKRLESLADTMDRSRSWLVNEAVELYLEHQDWMDLKTEEAIADIDAGAKLIPHEEVMARFEGTAKARLK